MTTPPNLQKLIITGKGGPDTISGKDGRIVEMWANEGIVRSLHAGSNITLDPTDGVDNGNGITISSSGGGGGGPSGTLTIQAGMDTNDYQASAIFLGPDANNSGGVANYPLFNNSSGSNTDYTYSSSWFVAGSGGDSMNFLPIITIPTFTGTFIIIQTTMNAAELFPTNTTVSVFTNWAIWGLQPQSITTGGTYQFPSSDYLQTAGNGTDLVMTSGTGTSGNGLVTTAGRIWYLASVQVDIVIPTGTTFT